MTRPKLNVPPVPAGGDAALYLNSLTDQGLTSAYMQFYVAAGEAAANLEPELLELIRLRNGVAQSCEYCLSVRLEGGRELGRDMQEKVVHFEESDLPERHKAALRLADAFLTLPGQLSARAREDALRHFTPAEIVALMLRLASFLVNKPRAALGIDGALNPDQLTQIDSAAAIKEFTPAS